MKVLEFIYSSLNVSYISLFILKEKKQMLAQRKKGLNLEFLNVTDVYSVHNSESVNRASL